MREFAVKFDYQGKIFVRRVGLGTGGILKMTHQDRTNITTYRMTNCDVVSSGYIGKIIEPHAREYTVTLKFGNREEVFYFDLDNERDEFAVMCRTAQRYQK